VLATAEGATQLSVSYRHCLRLTTTTLTLTLLLRSIFFGPTLRKQHIRPVVNVVSVTAFMYINICYLLLLVCSYPVAVVLQ
jgi:hypothetical protein